MFHSDTTAIKINSNLYHPIAIAPALHGVSFYRYATFIYENTSQSAADPVGKGGATGATRQRVGGNPDRYPVGLCAIA